ncbi:ABC transporter permease [Nocardioides gilvus]|uniref:ABC transporter permease n=1 Tax=Nocardioides gilvus TaxID=1735589 RepID=UPI000D74AA09|nr:ABC transporter permease [Nocardioides gilvus]
MSTLLTLVAQGLRQGLRDKTVILFGFVVPLVLMFVFNLVFGDTDEREFEPLTVAVGAQAGDQMVGVVTDVLGDLDSETLDVTVVEVDPDESRAMVADGDAGLAIVFPDNFGGAAQMGTPTTVDVRRGEDAGVEADVVLSVVDGILQQFGDAATTARAGLAEGLDAEQLAQVAQASVEGAGYAIEEGQADDQQLSAGGALVAGQAGLFLLFTVSFGVTALLVERENGTLARLRSLPLPAWQITTAKALVSFLTGMLSTGVLLTAGGFLFGASFGSLIPVALLVASVAAAATSVMFLIARVARTSEQAGVATSIVSIVLGVGGGAFFPISAAGALAGVLDLNPVAALLRGLGITSAGGGVADIGVPVAIMLGFAVVMLLVSRLVPDRGAMA